MKKADSSRSKRGESPVLTVRVPPRLYSALEKIAKKKGLRRSDVIRVALANYINENK